MFPKKRNLLWKRLKCFHFSCMANLAHKIIFSVKHAFKNSSMFWKSVCVCVVVVFFPNHLSLPRWMVLLYCMKIYFFLLLYIYFMLLYIILCHQCSFKGKHPTHKEWGMADCWQRHSSFYKKKENKNNITKKEKTQRNI